MEVSVARIRSKEINNIIQDRWEHKFLKPKILTSGTQLWISTLTLYFLREKKKKKKVKVVNGDKKKLLGVN